MRSGESVHRVAVLCKHHVDGDRAVLSRNVGSALDAVHVAVYIGSGNAVADKLKVNFFCRVVNIDAYAGPEFGTGLSGHGVKRNRVFDKSVFRGYAGEHEMSVADVGPSGCCRRLGPSLVIVSVYYLAGTGFYHAAAHGDGAAYRIGLKLGGLGVFNRLIADGNALHRAGVIIFGGEIKLVIACAEI